MRKVIVLFVLITTSLIANDFKNGLEALQNKEYQKAIILLEKVANTGHHRAQTALGHIYKDGKGVKTDFDKAIFWYEKAAIQDDIVAQYSLATILEKEKKDYNKAFAWYEEAAKQGALRAQYSLGLLYAKGLGTKKDELKAYKLFKIASRHIKEAKEQMQILCNKNSKLCK